MSALFALPKSAAEAPFKFELDAGPQQETWRRHFSSQPMVSEMRVGAGVLVERFGPIRFHFRLHAGQGRRNMLLQSVTVFGNRSPKFLMPTVLGQETGTQGRLHFDVSVHLPLAGLLAEYCGYLDIEDEGLAAGPSYNGVRLRSSLQARPGAAARRSAAPTACPFSSCW